MGDNYPFTRVDNGGPVSGERLAEIREQSEYCSITVEAEELLWLLDQADQAKRLRAENTAQAEQLDRATKLANQLCNCDSYDCPPTEPATGLSLRHHCECAALLMQTALDPAQGHQHEPCLTNDARALGLDQDGSSND